jgi:hypothetical protein
MASVDACGLELVAHALHRCLRVQVATTADLGDQRPQISHAQCAWLISPSLTSSSAALGT